MITTMAYLILLPKSLVKRFFTLGYIVIKLITYMF